MSSKKPSTNPASGFIFEQPFMGFSTKVRTVPISKGKGSGGIQVHNMNYGGSCREELIWDAREFLQSKTITWKQVKGSWDRVATLVRNVDLDDSTLKQPSVTYLWLSGDSGGDGYDGYYDDPRPITICTRKCCANRFPDLMDAIVGPLAVILNPNRYTGDWWRTSVEECVHKSGELRWYGTDNFFLRHPVLTSLVLGMFRQAALLYQQGYDQAILEKIQRREVESCLTESDPERAMRILESLKPWLALKNSSIARNLPFPAKNWDRLKLLHRTAFNHGYDALFGEGIHQAWNLGESNKNNEHGNYNNRYDVTTGPSDYFSAGKKNGAAQRLLKLGK